MRRVVAEEAPHRARLAAAADRDHARDRRRQARADDAQPEDAPARPALLDRLRPELVSLDLAHAALLSVQSRRQARARTAVDLLAADLAAHALQIAEASGLQRGDDLRETLVRHAVLRAVEAAGARTAHAQREHEPTLRHQHAAQLAERRRQIGPELQRVHGERVREALVLDRQRSSRPHAQLDPASVDRSAVSACGMAPHQIRVVHADDSPVARARRDLLDGEARPEAHLEHAVVVRELEEIHHPGVEGTVHAGHQPARDAPQRARRARELPEEAIQHGGRLDGAPFRRVSDG